MITNAEIADKFALAAKLLELHNGDERRIRTYGNAAYILERLEPSLYEMSQEQLTDIQGIGKSLAAQITAIIQTQTFKELTDLADATPAGVIDLFKVKGIGVKKIKQLWHDKGIDSLEKLKAACEANEIATMKGFGEKTQQGILASLEFIASQKGKLQLDKATEIAQNIQEILANEGIDAVITGQLLTNEPIIDTLSFLVKTQQLPTNLPANPLFVKDWLRSSPFRWSGTFDGLDTQIQLWWVLPEQWGNASLLTTASDEHLLAENEERKSLFSLLRSKNFDSDEAVYAAYQSGFVVPEMRHSAASFTWAKHHQPNELISWDKLQGSLHNHSTYSDGRHTLKQMADYCQSLGLKYFGIADHSQTATYAQGLTPARVQQQHAEIDELNKENPNFYIFKGIESDILNDGRLDYEDEVLASFDYVVASVHQNLQMDMVKATDRLITAIANPFTTILGHPTGRLLLAREGYPIDYKAVIDACATYGVVMELNANPYRLDLDWQWIGYCLERGVKISINPDAHEMAGFHDMEFGIRVARKAGLTVEQTFNALPLSDLQLYLQTRKARAIG